jgi:hypothetical protein
MKTRAFLLVLTLCFMGVVSVLILPYVSVAREPDPGDGYGNKDPLAPTNGLPDLILDEFSMVPERPRVDEPVVISVRARNAGPVDSPGVRVNLYIDPPVQPPTSETTRTSGFLYSVTMPPDAWVKATFSGYTFTVPGCDHVVYAWADPLDDGLPGPPGIDESDETNNLRVIHLCVDPETTALPGADTFEADDDCDLDASIITTDGTPQVRSFAPAGDVDYVKFDVTAGVVYTVTATGTGSHANPSLEISDSCSFAPRFGKTTHLQFAAPGSGTYYLKLTNDKPNPDPNKATYQLMVQAEVQPPTGDPPIVSSISPISGTNDANTNVIVTGAQFLFPTLAEICDYRDGGCTEDCVQLLDTTWRSINKLYGVVPANLDPGRYCVQATNPGGKSDTLADSFTLNPAQPVPDDVDPPAGYGDTSTDLHVYGFNFDAGVLLSLDSVDLENVKVINGTHVIGTLPAGELGPGSHDLLARYPGELAGQLVDAFTVMASFGDLFAQDDELFWEPMVPYAGNRIDVGLVVHRRGGDDLLTDLPVSFAVNGAPIGDAIIPNVAIDGEPNTPRVPFTPTVEGTYTVTAVIDPENTVLESTWANNMVTRTIEVLPAGGDVEAPIVNSLTINGGAGQVVTSTEVTLSVEATDVGGSDVAEIRYVEFEYSQGARLWIPVQDSHWLNYTLNRSNRAWELTPVGGTHYIQAWTKDSEGNISHYPYQVYVTYLPPSEWVGPNQARSYRRTLAAGESLSVTVTPLSGDPDLFVWPPDWEGGREPWVSDRIGTVVDDIAFTAPVSGVYLVEVRVHPDVIGGARYELEIQTGSGAALAPQSSARVLGYRAWSIDPGGTTGPPDSGDPAALVGLSRVVIGGGTSATGMADAPDVYAATVGVPKVFSATVRYPVTGTISVPITYTWQATGQSPVSEAKVSVHSDVAFTWLAAGSYAITVTAENAEGSVVDSRLVDASGGGTLHSVVISGPTAGFVGTEYVYTADAFPITAGTGGWPITYTWEATGQGQVVHGNAGPIDTITYTWPTAGSKAITVTVTDVKGSAPVQDHVYPVISDYHRVYLPLVLRGTVSGSLRLYGR